MAIRIKLNRPVAQQLTSVKREVRRGRHHRRNRLLGVVYAPQFSLPLVYLLMAIILVVGRPVCAAPHRNSALQRNSVRRPGILC